MAPKEVSGWLKGSSFAGRTENMLRLCDVCDELGLLVFLIGVQV